MLLSTMHHMGLSELLRGPTIIANGNNRWDRSPTLTVYAFVLREITTHTEGCRGVRQRSSTEDADCLLNTCQLSRSRRPWSTTRGLCHAAVNKRNT